MVRRLKNAPLYGLPKKKGSTLGEKRGSTERDIWMRKDKLLSGEVEKRIRTKAAMKAK